MYLIKYILVVLFCAVVYYSSSAIGTTNYLILFSAQIIPVFCYKKIFDKQILYLLLFSFTYVIITSLSREVDIKDVFGYLICPIAFFLWGKYIIRSFLDKPIIIEGFFLMMVLAFSVVFYYYSYLDYLIVGTENVTRKLIIEGTVDKNATYYGLVGSVGLAGISIFLYNLKIKQNLILYGFLVVGVSSTLCIMHLVNRTGFVLIAATIFLLIVYRFSGQRKFTISGVFFVIVIGLVVYYITTDFSSVEIFAAYDNRSDSLEGAGHRSWRWMLGLENLLYYPMGWSTVAGYQKLYVHNLWLDISRSGGVLPFVFYLICTSYDIKHSLKIFRNKNKNIIGFLLLSYYVVFSLSSFVEPVIDGCVLYFYLYCMIGGCLSQYCREQRIQSLNNN